MTLIDLTNKVALVTGGSRGVGAAAAVMFGEAGAKVAITYRERKDRADEVLAEIDALGKGQAIALQADLAERSQAERVVEETVEQFGRLDYFVANAGIWPVEDTSVRDMDDDRWRRTMGVNLDSVFYGCRSAMGVLETGGSIVVVTSTAGQRGEAFHADYAATKGALISFVKSLAVEAGPKDITVNSVAPGWIDTEMSAVPYEKDGGAGKKRIEASIPLGRVASSHDVAGPIVFLCSSMARSITGEILNVNGGSVLCG